MREDVEMALADFNYWCKWPMGLKHWKIQDEWGDRIQYGLEREDIKGILLLAPPDYGKTSQITIPLKLWLLARNQNNRIIMGSGKDDYAEQMGRAAARRIMKTKELKELFNIEPSGDKWSDQEYMIKRPDWEDKNASILCIGANSDVISQRSDFNVLDDWLTPKNSKTVAQREKIRSMTWTEVGSRLERGGKWIVMGHRVHEDDLYSEIKKKDGWIVCEYQAIVNDLTKEVLAPEHYTYDELAEKRSDDPVGFSTFFQQHPITFGLYVSRSMLEPLKDMNRPMLDHIPPEIRAKYKFITMSVDPAFTKNRWSSYTVIQIWGIAPDGKRRDLLYALRALMNPTELKDALRAKIRIYKPDYIYVEGNAAQIMIISGLKDFFPEMASDRIQAVFTLNPNNRLEEEMGRLFELISGGASNYTLPYGDKAAQQYTDSLIEELITFPGRTKDSVMAWYINERGIGAIKSRAAHGWRTQRGAVGAVSDRVKGGMFNGSV